jgi:hypothetical protein
MKSFGSPSAPSSLISYKGGNGEQVFAQTADDESLQRALVTVARAPEVGRGEQSLSFFRYDANGVTQIQQRLGDGAAPSDAFVNAVIAHNKQENEQKKVILEFNESLKQMTAKCEEQRKHITTLVEANQGLQAAQEKSAKDMQIANEWAHAANQRIKRLEAEIATLKEENRQLRNQTYEKSAGSKRVVVEPASDPRPTKDVKTEVSEEELLKQAKSTLLAANAALDQQ